jgi:hypothetical protein
MHPRSFLTGLACALAAAFVPFAARADVVDLSQGGRRGGNDRPPAFVLKLDGGTDTAPFGRVGGVLSYLNEAALTEIEAGVGAGFPGTQLGLSVRKLFGEGGDYFVVELSLAGNTKTVRGRDVLNPAKGSHVWSNLGLGFEHRLGVYSFGITGGATFISFSQTPQAFAHAALGFGF